MKDILLSIHPKWCEKILSGEKTIEVRKTVPKIAPFKVFIYCTKSGDRLVLKSDKYFAPSKLQTGKVIGEFICDKVSTYIPLGIRGFEEVSDNTLAKMCLSKADLDKYGGLKTLYGWHISDLKIYDKPRELSEFSRPCVTPTKDCEHCIRGGTPYTWGFDEKIGKIYCTRRLSKAPQSWQYVEEVEQ